MDALMFIKFSAPEPGRAHHLAITSRTAPKAADKDVETDRRRPKRKYLDLGDGDPNGDAMAHLGRALACRRSRHSNGAETRARAPTSPRRGIANADPARR